MEAFAVAARAIFGGYFVMNGLLHFGMLNMMAQWTGTKGIPSPKLAVAGSGLLILLGGLSILLGLWAWLGAVLIIAFLVPVTLMMNNFWTVTDPMQKQMEMANFMKNIALIGAALMFLFADAELKDVGPWSIT